MPNGFDDTPPGNHLEVVAAIRKLEGRIDVLVERINGHTERISDEIVEMKEDRKRHSDALRRVENGALSIAAFGEYSRQTNKEIRELRDKVVALQLKLQVKAAFVSGVTVAVVFFAKWLLSK